MRDPDGRGLRLRHAIIQRERYRYTRTHPCNTARLHDLLYILGRPDSSFHEHGARVDGHTAHAEA